ncbi:MAG: ABC transporter permease [Chloroflexota bacterium]
MKIIASLTIAIRSLLANKLRSSLTMLGLMIGVGAVITLMSLGGGLQAYLNSTFEGLGTNVIYVQPQNPDAPGGAGIAPGYAVPSLTLADAEAIADIPSVIRVAPVNENFVGISYGNENISSVVEGANEAFLVVNGYEMGTGRFISDLDVASRNNVVVLGSKVATKLFGSREPTGQFVKIQKIRFKVIGVMAARGGGFFGVSFDDLIAVPITTFQSRLFIQRTPSGEDAVQSIAVMASSAETVEQVRADVESTLRKRHRIASDEKDDFAILSLDELMGVFGSVTLGLTVFLGLIASISLLVGSIGIMNIMLVSVTERTREIGIRRAVGAKRRDILLQFLLEAVTLSLIGGGIGVLGGIGVSEGISWIIAYMDIGFSINAVVSPFIVILAVSVSVIIGLISGIYPAGRAARLNPIDALHYR